MATLQPVDLVNAKANTDFIERFATEEALTTTDRLGRTRRTIAGIENYATERIDESLTVIDEKVEEATDQAGVATAQAGLATTNGAAQVALASAARAGAETALASTNVAAAIAMASGRIYSTPAAGVNPAGTPPGVGVNEFFLVLGAAGYVFQLYQNVAGVATIQPGKTVPSGDATDVYRGTTEAGEVVSNNFNLLIKPGWYYNARTGACSNTPFGTAVAIGPIHVERVGPDLGQRTYFKDGALDEAYMCTFVFSTGAISTAWKRILGPGQLFAALFGRLSEYRGSFESTVVDATGGLNYTNFNLAVLTGIYWNQRTGFVSNSPYGTAIAPGYIRNITLAPDLMLQTWYKEGANPLDVVWSRTYIPSTTTWGAWAEQTSLTAKIPATRLADNFPLREVLTARPVNTDRDINKALLPGNYTLAAGVAVLNTPAGSGASTAYPGTLNVAIVGGRTIQTLYVNDSADTVWVKSFVTGSPGGTWVPRFNPHAGISMALVGDSNGAGTPGAGTEGSYLVQIARLMGVPYVNYSVGGASMEDRPIAGGVTVPINNAAFCNVTAAGALAAHNLVLVVMGTNFGTATVLGPLNSTDKTQFYGAMRVGYDNIRAGNPNARIVFGLPIYSNAAGNTVQARRDAITAWCQMMNLPVIDFCGKAGVNAVTAATDMVDDIHIGPTGHSKAAGTGFGQLQSVVG